MNEFIFFLHIILIGVASSIALRLGKEALITLICIQAILSNLFVTKQILLFGLATTCADSFSVGSSLCLNLLQEYFGKKTTKIAILISFFCLIFYLAMTQIHLIYYPSFADFTQNHFYCLFQFMPRIIISSVIAYFISQQADVKLYSFFSKKVRSTFILKNYASLVISQLIDTFIFSLLGLFGIVENIFQLIILSYTVKLITIALLTPLTALIKKQL